MLVRAATSAMYCRLLFMVCSALGVCEAAMPHPKTSPSSVVIILIFSFIIFIIMYQVLLAAKLGWIFHFDRS